MFKRILRWTLLSLVATVSVLVISAVVLWRWPELVLTPSRTLSLVQLILPEQNISANIRKLSLDWRGWKAKRIEIEMSDVCSNLDAPKNRICFKSLVLYADLRLSNANHWLSVENLLAEAGTLDWSETLTKEPPPAEADSRWIAPPAILDRIAFDKVLIGLETATFKVADKTITGNVSLQLPHREAQPRLNAKAKVDDHEVEVSLRGDWEPAKISWAGKAAYQQKKLSIKAALEGSYTPEGITTEITAEGEGLSPYLPKATVNRCKIDYRAPQQELSTECPFSLVGNVCRTRDGLCHQVADKSNGTLIGKVRQQKNSRVSGNIGLTLFPLVAALNEGKLSVTATFNGDRNDLPNLEIKTKAVVELPLFQHLVALSRNKPWAIPAPLNQLRGSVRAQLDAEGKLLNHEGKIPVQLVTRLSSPNQRLDIDAEGSVTLGRSTPKLMTTHLDLGVAFTDVQLMLPNLKLTGLPQVIPDSRLNPAKPPPEKEVTDRFTYSVHLHTKSRPVRLVSNLVKDSVPFNVDLHLESGVAPQGKIAVLPFNIEVLRRKATVRSMDVGLKKDPRYNDVVGEIVVKQLDYTVIISLMGLLDEPRIAFTSEPPLPQDQVIAVLLTGKPFETLTAEESNSVGQMKAAVQDQAISTASMFLLASTPVESVGYNSYTNEITAKLRLADGTSFTVGSDTEKVSQLGVRHSLGSNWWLNTYMKDPFVGETRSIAAVLEWALRY